MDSIVSSLSPLNSFWNSDQADSDEAQRLAKGNLSSPASSLFVNEPYKWENLFQSIVFQLINGDQDSIKGFNLLLSTLNSKEQTILVDRIDHEKIFNESILRKIKSTEHSSTSSKTKSNYLRFLKILFAIFTNPFRIHLKRKKEHIYEYTGFFFYHIRNIQLK